MSDPEAERARRAAAERRLLIGAMVVFVLLVIQNGIGIFLNLYVRVSDSQSYSGVFAAMFASPAGWLHSVVAVLLLVASGAAIGFARKTEDAPLRWISIAVLASFAVAAYSGFHFVANADDLYSLTMELGFLGMVLGEAAVVFRIAQLRGIRPASPTTSAPSLKIPEAT